MNTKQEKLSRLTIQIPESKHREIKILASAKGKSMTTYILESLEKIKEDSISDTNNVTNTIIQGFKDIAQIKTGNLKANKAKGFLNAL